MEFPFRVEWPEDAIFFALFASLAFAFCAFFVRWRAGRRAKSLEDARAAKIAFERKKPFEGRPLKKRWIALSDVQIAAARGVEDAARAEWDAPPENLAKAQMRRREIVEREMLAAAGDLLSGMVKWTAGDVSPLRTMRTIWEWAPETMHDLVFAHWTALWAEFCRQDKTTNLASGVYPWRADVVPPGEQFEKQWKERELRIWLARISGTREVAELAALVFNMPRLESWGTAVDDAVERRQMRFLEEARTCHAAFWMAETFVDPTREVLLKSLACAYALYMKERAEAAGAEG